MPARRHSWQFFVACPVATGQKEILLRAGVASIPNRLRPLSRTGESYEYVPCVDP